MSLTDRRRAPSLAGNAALTLSAQVAANIGYFIAVLELARGLDPSQRGTVAFVSVTAMIVARVVNVGIDEATVVLTAQRVDQRGRLLANLLLSVTVTTLAGGLVLSGTLLAVGARPAGLEAHEIVMLGFTFLASGLGSAGLAFIRGCSRFRFLAVALVMGPWLYAGSLAALWIGGGLTTTRAIAAWIGAHLLAALIQLAASARYVRIRPPDLRLWAETLRFGVRAWAGTLSWSLNARVDQVLLGIMAAESVLGIYAVAVNASEVLFYLPAAVAQALVPYLATRGASAGSQTLSALRIVLIVLTAASAAAAALGFVLVPFVFGEPYRDSITPFLWLLPAALGFAMAAMLSHGLMAATRPGLSSVGPVVAVASMVVLDLILIPPFGAAGAAAAASGAWLCGGFAAMAAYRRHEPWPWSALLPRPADLWTIEALVRRALRKEAPAT